MPTHIWIASVIEDVGPLILDKLADALKRAGSCALAASHVRPSPMSFVVGAATDKRTAAILISNYQNISGPNEPRVTPQLSDRWIPGISAECDEGEGKFVQIRGTEPRLSNVTMNGVHIPGRQSGSRVAKLDDVPTNILAAIEVSKTLTANQDADAIGGSVNLVTPEGAPRGYVAGQLGQSTLEGRQQGQGSAMWGGRFGDRRRRGRLCSHYSGTQS